MISIVFRERGCRFLPLSNRTPIYVPKNVFREREKGREKEGIDQIGVRGARGVGEGGGGARGGGGEKETDNQQRTSSVGN